VYKSHNAFNRKAPLPAGAIQSVARVYTEHKEISSALNAKRNARSIVGELIRKSAGEGGEKAREEAMQEARMLKKEVTELEIKLQDLEEQLLSLALAIPNDTHPLSPLGPETAAKMLSMHGPPPIPASPARDHVFIGRALNLFDLQAGAAVTGNSWYYLMNEGALLEMALTNYALSVAVRHGFAPVMTPDVVHSDIARRCGFQPRDHSDPLLSQMYHITDPWPGHRNADLVLSGTAEIPLAGLFANKIISTPVLPVKVVGLGRAFRAEAGARGTDTRGLYRVHQFTKVELFAVTRGDESEQMMEEIRRVQQKIFEGLGLSFR
jgi:seryl-tRNA synthetase